MNYHAIDLSQDPNAVVDNTDLFELTYVTGGRAVRVYSDEETPIQKGDFFLSEPSRTSTYKSKQDFSLLRFFFTSDFIDKGLVRCNTFFQLTTSWLVRFRYLVPATFFGQFVLQDSTGEVFLLFEKARAQKQASSYGHIEFIRTYMIQILLHICCDVMSIQQTRIHDKYLRKIIGYCEKHYAEDIQLGTLCREIGYSLSHISIKFKTLTGMNFTSFLQYVRITNACDLLSATDKKIPEIANMVGYNDTKAFYRVFKIIMATTPSKYRQNCRI